MKKCKMSGRLDLADPRVNLKSFKRKTVHVDPTLLMDTGSDQQNLTEEEQKLIKMYGRLPNKKSLLGSKLKDRKFFDSGDYALSRAGKDEPGLHVGHQHPTPENIPHSMTSPLGRVSTNGQGSSGPSTAPLSGSPVKEPSMLHSSNLPPRG